MRKILQTVAISAMLLAPASAAHAQISFGIRIGEPLRARTASRLSPARTMCGSRLLVSAGIAYAWPTRLDAPAGKGIWSSCITSTDVFRRSLGAVCAITMTIAGTEADSGRMSRTS
jgi:hypothetical protein